ncbi:Acyl-CoA hydrolase [Sinosporangium album]|uniref:Acyl-CoA hydrolase n=1 Tax=Sinosporangium album TaxID=504805 RepID=A0A1G7ZJR6_9ACTN|nr:acetyl-CoA hydrolase/transferase C-terminal domain-containing protein [Sinosporangium album]SDH08340.1 Acyl-CoA hydrolase [Sinosporangium album]
MTADFDDRLARLVKPGARIALADGLGTPRVLHGPLSRAAEGRAVRLVLGWLPMPAPDLDASAFADVRIVVGGPGTRAMVEAGQAHAVPARISAVPALLSGPLRPDLLIATVVQRPDGLHFGTEVGYLRGLVDAGVPVGAVVSSGSPCADAGRALPDELVTVIGETGDTPGEVGTPAPTDADVAIATRVARLVPEYSRVQIGPGRLAQAMVSALEVPVRIDSGLLPDPVVDLDEKGLLVGEPVAAYLSGTRRLYEWADTRPILHPVETIHDTSRLSSPDLPPLIALNSALEIDVEGQVNVEGVGPAAVGMIGGHPDFAVAGVRGRGLSLIAIASAHNGRSTLVNRLSRPVTTGSHDVDIVVTDRGIADLRGLDRPERRRALLDLWDGEVAER